MIYRIIDCYIINMNDFLQKCCSLFVLMLLWLIDLGIRLQYCQSLQCPFLILSTRNVVHEIRQKTLYYDSSTVVEKQSLGGREG